MQTVRLCCRAVVGGSKSTCYAIMRPGARCPWRHFRCGRGFPAWVCVSRLERRSRAAAGRLIDGRCRTCCLIVQFICVRLVQSVDCVRVCVCVCLCVYASVVQLDSSVDQGRVSKWNVTRGQMFLFQLNTKCCSCKEKVFVRVLI